MSDLHVYKPSKIEPKWQEKWFSGSAFKTDESAAQPKYYVLEMFPYPSGQLHMGHVRNYTLGDTLARFKRARGFNVLHPMGWDSFGLPAENAALKRNIHPSEWTVSNIKKMKETMRRFGWSYDWNREVTSCMPDYYKHQQAIFTDMLEKGLAYRKKSVVNWDPIENTVLANEQVVDGKGWRSGEPIERRTMYQWHFKITDYAQELLDDLKLLKDWPERVKTMQKNWLGRSEGLKFHFNVNGWDKKLEVYTTRPDTLYGCTFCAIAPEHPLALKTAKNDSEATSFIEECQGMGTSEEAIEKANKKGYKTPYTAIHPLTGKELPIYIANFVLMSYGTGAIMSVPAHDERDFAFAKKYNLPIIRVVARDDVPEDECHTLSGTIVNSDKFDGMVNEEAIAAMIQHFEDNKLGERTINWRLRDWGISRQRYWGCPIPVIHCDKCGVIAVPKEDLPIELPQDVNFNTQGNPLERHPTWKNCSCPKCGSEATRETDTMDTFVDSSWYFLRYTCPQSNNVLNKPDVDYWLGNDKNGGADQYIGGIEHAVLHLLYSRFFTKVLRDLGYVNIHEPFKALLCQGMLIGNTYQTASGEYIYPNMVEWKNDKAFHKETKEELRVLSAEKISKSKNNGDSPDALIDRFGADTLRLFILFTAPPERDLEWSESAIEGAWRFINRIWELVKRVKDDKTAIPEFSTLENREERDMLRLVHKTIRKVTKDIDSFHYNTMVAACMELANALQTIKDNASTNMLTIRRFGVEKLIQMLNPACPHVTEELWEFLGNNTMLCKESWPEFDQKAADDEEITLVVQINGKLKGRLQVIPDMNKDEAIKLALEEVSEHLEGLTIRKEIHVPNRLVNIVAN